jgi:hypothetical protein
MQYLFNFILILYLEDNAINYEYFYLTLPVPFHQ